MPSLCGRVRLATMMRIPTRPSPISTGLEMSSLDSNSNGVAAAIRFNGYSMKYFGSFLSRVIPKFSSCSGSAVHTKIGTKTDLLPLSKNNGVASAAPFYGVHGPGLFQLAKIVPTSPSRCITTMGDSVKSISEDTTASSSDVMPRIKFKRPDKTARHIMQIIDKEAVEEVREKREIPDIRPGYIIQLKVEVPENKRRISTLKGTVIARRNAGLNTTFRLRRPLAGVWVESLFPLYSPNIKEIKVLDKKRVRRAKLYYLRDKTNSRKKR